MAEHGSPAVLVTGAGGFLGGTVCDDLLAHGFAVRAMTRTDAQQRRAGLRRAEKVVAELADIGSLHRAADGVDAVVHLAARVHVMRETANDPLKLYRETNVEGTRAILDAAISAGARRFIFISSVKAVGETGDAPFTSTTPPSPRDPYGVSKLEAEAIVRGAASPGCPTSITILRLPLVYGPGMGGNMLRLFDIVSRGIYTPLPVVTNARSMVYSGNVAAAIRHVLQLPTPPAGPLFVSDGQDVSTSELLCMIANALGRTPRILRVPKALATLARLLGSAAAAVGVHSLRQAERRLFGSLQVSATELRDVAGFVPPYTLREGLRRTADWYLSRPARADT